MDKLLSFLQKNAKEGFLSWQTEQQAYEAFNYSYHEIEKVALKNNICPGRYQRNQNTISIIDQLTLMNSAICVIGLGGLGGYIIEELARIGIGNLTIFDFDTFEDHNLNRQLYSTIDSLENSKINTAKARIQAINPAVNVMTVSEPFGINTNEEHFKDVNIVIDALDNIQTKMSLAKLCNKKSLYLVHGAIAGWYGQVAVQGPSENTVANIYKNATYEKGVETEMGNPAFTPAVIASFQVSETIKILLNKKEATTNRVYFIDLLSLKINEISLWQED